MYRSKFILVAALGGLLSACATSNDYIGQTYEIPRWDRCTLETRAKCLQKIEDFDFNFAYNVFQTSESKYSIQGEVIWSGSSVFEESRNLNIEFLVFSDDTVIEIVRTWGKGRNLSAPIKIDVAFDSTGFDFVMVGSYRYSISE